MKLYFKLHQKHFFRRKIGVRERERVDKKSDKKWRKKEGVQPKKSDAYYTSSFMYVFVTQSFLLYYSWSSANITENSSRKIRATIKTHPRAYQCIWDNHIIRDWYLYKYIIIPLLYQYGLLIHTCVSKMQLCLKIRFSTSFYITRHAEAALHTKNLFLLFHSLIFLVNTTGEVID